VLLSATVNDSGGETARGCFIATAAFGSYFEPNVIVLREFRDKWLIADFGFRVSDFHIKIPNVLGRAFVSFYYKYSPPVADYLRMHEPLRLTTRWTLTPIVYCIKHPVDALMSFFFVIVAAYFKRRRCIKA